MSSKTLSSMILDSLSLQIDESVMSFHLLWLKLKVQGRYHRRLGSTPWGHSHQRGEWQPTKHRSCQHHFSNWNTFRCWSAQNGDDCNVSARSTNIVIEDTIFHDGQVVAIGSIGQYMSRFKIVENVNARNMVANNSRWIGRIKAWTGEQDDCSSNAGEWGIICELPFDCDSWLILNGLIIHHRSWRKASGIIPGKTGPSTTANEPP